MTKNEYECTILICFGWLMGWSIAGVYHITVRNDEFDQLRRGMCPSMMWGFAAENGDWTWTQWRLRTRCVEAREKIIVYIYMDLYRFMQLNHGSYGGNQQQMDGIWSASGARPHWQVILFAATTGVYWSIYPTLHGHEMRDKPLDWDTHPRLSKYFGVDVTQVFVFVSKTQIMSLEVPHAMSIWGCWKLHQTIFSGHPTMSTPPQWLSSPGNCYVLEMRHFLSPLSQSISESLRSFCDPHQCAKVILIQPYPVPNLTSWVFGKPQETTGWLLDYPKLVTNGSPFRCFIVMIHGLPCVLMEGSLLWSLSPFFNHFLPI